MKSMGMVRKLDTVGRIVIPRELLKTMQMKPSDPIEIFTEDNQIILKKYEPGCFLCGDLHAIKKVTGGAMRLLNMEKEHSTKCQSTLWNAHIIARFNN